MQWIPYPFLKGSLMGPLSYSKGFLRGFCPGLKAFLKGYSISSLTVLPHACMREGLSIARGTTAVPRASSARTDPAIANQTDTFQIHLILSQVCNASVAM